jgi:hypothetical protein
MTKESFAWLLITVILTITVLVVGWIIVRWNK